MGKKIINLANNRFLYGIHLILLPIFFILHGYVDFFRVLPFKNILQLIAVYLSATGILFIIFFFFLKSFSRAAIFTFIVMSYHFFFGAMHDTAKNILGINFFTSYSFILPLSVVAFAVVYILIKRTKSSLIKFHFFLDFLFLTLIAIDLTNIATQMFSSNNPKTALAKTTFIKCDTCTKPNIYFIVFDGYAGNYELQNTLGFDNSAFENELQNKGFHIIKNSISNYNSTPFSLASILNMEYLQGISRNHENRNDIITCYEKINKSKIGYFFDSAGYQIKNLSIFNFNDFETKANEFILFPTKAGLITNQTFLSRLKKDLGYHIITAFHLKSEMSRMAYSVLKDNNATYDQLMKEVQRPSDKPTFIYAHFMMPHYPYYYSADGKLRPIDSLGFAGLKPRLYIGYLQYCNKKISSMIDQILAHSKRKPIIFLIGDHGFREFNKSIDPKYFFYNLSSVYLPNQSYSIFYNGMSNVNLFRSLLNTQFNQNLPMLKDSTVLIK